MKTPVHADCVCEHYYQHSWYGKLVNSRFTDPTHVIEMPEVVEVLASSAFDSAVF